MFEIGYYWDYSGDFESEIFCRNFEFLEAIERSQHWSEVSCDRFWPSWRWCGKLQYKWSWNIPKVSLHIKHTWMLRNVSFLDVSAILAQFSGLQVFGMLISRCSSLSRWDQLPRPSGVSLEARIVILRRVWSPRRIESIPTYEQSSEVYDFKLIHSSKHLIQCSYERPIASLSSGGEDQ